MSAKRIGIFLFLVFIAGILSGCLEDKTAPQSDVTPTEVVVSVSPTTLTLPTGATKAFTASLTGSGNTAVRWSVTEGASGGTISSTGVYSAPTISGIFHVVATSLVDEQKSATATVVVSSALDGAFGVGGIVQTGFGGNDRVNALTLQADGKILAAGFALKGTKNTFALARYASDGSIDTGFGENGKATTAIGSASEAQALALQPDGKIVVGGFAFDGNKNIFALVRYHSNGTIDTGFGNGGIVTTAVAESGKIKAVVVQSDGKIVVGGFSLSNFSNKFTLARYNSNGTLDTAFATSGIEITAFSGASEITSLAIQSDGKVVAAGFANGALNDFALARYSSNGILDTSFDTDGKVSIVEVSAQEIHGVIVQSDGKIVAGGFAANATDNDFAVYRFTSTGALDTTFGTGGKVITPIGTGNERITGLAIQSGGELVAAGFSFNGTDNDFALVRYNSNGSLDTTFDGDGKLTTAIGSGTDEAKGVLIQGDGKIVVGGFTSSSLRSEFVLARYLTAGTLDTDFDADGIVVTPIEGGNDEIKAIGMQSNGKLIAAGYAFGVNGNLNNDFAIARYNGDGSLDGRTTTAIGTKDDAAHALVIQPDDKIVVGGAALITVFSETTSDFALVRYLANGFLDTSFGTGGQVTTPIGTGNESVSALALQADGKIVAAGTAFVGTNNAVAVARYTATGVLDTTFDGDGKLTTVIGTGSSFGKGVQIQADGKILVGGMASNGSDFDFALVRYNANGSLDTGFGTAGIVTTPVGSGHDIANALTLQSDGKILVVGGTITGTPSGAFVLVRYNTDGSLDTGFGGSGIVISVIGAEGGSDSQALAVVTDAEGKIVVGGFVYSAGNNRDFALARFLADGSLDPTFGVDGKEISPLSAGIDEIHSLIIQAADGKIVAGGTLFNANNENADFALTRYLP